MKKTKLRIEGVSDVATDKKEIQRLVREVVIRRDGGCVLRNVYGIPRCNGYAPSDGHLILQADHLITRGNSATYDDTRLIVCVCKGHHGWKKWNEKQYEDAIRKVLPPDRVLLWEQAEQERWRPVPKRAHDWKLSILALKKELSTVKVHPDYTSAVIVI